MEKGIGKDTELVIDGIRGIAALLVAFTHSFDLAVADAYGWNYANNPEGWRWARASLGHGGFLVWCFFVISGFCIHHSISRSVTRGDFSLWRYAVGRLTRIYPLFMLGLGLAFIAWICHDDYGDWHNDAPWRELGASLFSLQILTTPFPAYETSWSLSCEMIYYILWPVALLATRGRVNWAAAVSMLSVLLVGSVIMFSWKVLHRMEYSAMVQGVWIVSVLLPVWVCGAWLAGNWGHPKLNISRRVWIGSIFLCFLSEILLIVLKFKQYPIWAVHLAGLSSVPGLLLFLAGAHHTRLSERKWAPGVCRWLGQFSYPCYILHMQILLLINHLRNSYAAEIGRRHPIWQSLIEFGLVMVILVWLGPRLDRATMAWRTRVLSKIRGPKAPIRLQSVPLGQDA